MKNFTKSSWWSLCLTTPTSCAPQRINLRYSRSPRFPGPRHERKYFETLGKDFHVSKEEKHGNFLAVQWLGLYAFTAEGPGSIPGWGTKIPQATRPKKRTKKKKREEKQENTIPFVPLDLLWTLHMKSAPALAILLAAWNKASINNGMKRSQVQENVIGPLTIPA